MSVGEHVTFMPWSGNLYLYELVGERVYLYALVGRTPRSGNGRSGNARSEKTRGAADAQEKRYDYTLPKKMGLFYNQFQVKTGGLSSVSN